MDTVDTSTRMVISQGAEGEVAAVWVALDQLKAWADNPRDNDGLPVEEVAKSIAEDGQFGAPIVARKADGMILAGHTRYKAAQKLGMERVPVRYLDLPLRKAKKHALKDNKTAELARWNDPMLAAVIAELRREEPSLQIPGFDPAELDRLVRDALAEGMPVHDGDVGDLVDHATELQAKWHTEAGQLWQIASNALPGMHHRIYCGDSRNADDVVTLLAEAPVNVAITSPPYASQREYDGPSGFTPIAADQYVEWFDAVQASVAAHLAADGSWFVNIKEHCEDGERVLYVKDLTLTHVRRWGWRFVDEFCWTRQGVPGAWNNRFKNGWEPIFHFARQSAIKFHAEAVMHWSDDVCEYAPTNPKSSSGSGLLSNPGIGVRGLARPNNVIQCATGGTATSAAHPAAYPVGLPAFFIAAYSDRGDRIFDPFLGSGTTLLAAEQLGRIGYGMELSPKYVAVCLERLAGMGLEPRRV